MTAIWNLCSAIALLLAALGGLLWAVGRDKRGARLLCVALVLMIVRPILVGGLMKLLQLEVRHRRWTEIAGIAAALFAVAVVLAGIVALRRHARPRADATSHKKRGEQGL